MPHFGELPTIHHTRHETGGVDEIDVSGLHGQTLWVPYNGKIADINETDVARHTLDLEAALPETRKIIALQLIAVVQVGAGNLAVYPNEGAWGFGVVEYGSEGEYAFVVIADGTQRLQYSQTVANEDFDLYCLGYVVEV